jgi:hypothetical protein
MKRKQTGQHKACCFLPTINKACCFLPTINRIRAIRQGFHLYGKIIMLQHFPNMQSIYLISLFLHIFWLNSATLLPFPGHQKLINYIMLIFFFTFNPNPNPNFWSLRSWSFLFQSSPYNYYSFILVLVILF